MVALDSQCLSFLIDCMEGISEPADTLAEEKIALLRIFFYTPSTYLIPATVKKEYLDIPDDKRRKLHDSWVGVIFEEQQISDIQKIDERVKQLLKHHDRYADCRILAEVEYGGCEALLSYDRKFLRNLAERTIGLELIRPSEYWNRHGIPRGSDPVTVPHETNPLFNQTWWQW